MLGSGQGHSISCSNFQTVNQLVFYIFYLDLSMFEQVKGLSSLKLFLHSCCLNKRISAPCSICIVNIFNGIIVYKPSKSTNKEQFSNWEQEQKTRERKREVKTSLESMNETELHYKYTELPHLGKEMRNPVANDMTKRIRLDWNTILLCTAINQSGELTSIQLWNNV